MTLNSLRYWKIFSVRTTEEIPVQNTKSVFLDETDLDAVRGLIKPRGFRPSASTSRARRSDAATSDKDKHLLRANLKGLIQSGRIQIRIASFFLIPFGHLSVCEGPTCTLYQYYITFSVANIISRFLSSSCGLEFSSLDVKYDDKFGIGDEGTWQKPL